MSLYATVALANQRRPLSLSRFALFLSLFICIAVPLSLHAQSSRPDRGTGQGPQQVTGLDDINLQNGSVSMDIPLASLPPMAGGKLGYTLTAHYNSNQWHAWRSENEGPVNGGLDCPNVYTTGLLEPTTYPTWTIGAGYEIIFKDAYNDDFSYDAPSSFTCGGYEYYNMQGRFFRPVLKTPDGGEHEMRIDGSNPTYGGTRAYLSGYYQQSGGTPNQPVFSSPTRFYTTDGTYLTAVVNPSSYSTKWTVYSKDGTKIEQTASKQTITDTNGNSIEFGVDPTYGYNYAKDVYTTRLIKWSTSGSTTTVQYQSTGGSWQSVLVTWDTTMVQGMAYSMTTYDSYLETTCTVDQIVPQTAFSVIRSIEFPKTDTDSGALAPKYIFAYNSDGSTSSETISSPQWGCSGTSSPYTRNVSYGWGQLSSATTPSGAIITYAYGNDGQHDYRAADELSSQDAATSAQKITQKQIQHDGVTDTWSYSINPSVVGGPSYGQVTAPDGSTTSDKYYPTDPNYPWLTGTDGQSGLVYKSVRPGGVLVEKHWTLLGGTSLYAFGSVTNKVSYNAVVDTEYTTLLDTDNTTRLKMTAKSFAYDYNGDLTSTTEYDWINLGSVTYTNSNNSVTGIPTAIPSGTSILRVTNNSYYNTASSSSSSTAYHKRTVGSSTVILGKPAETTVGTSSTTKSDTKFSYDGNTWGTVPSVGNLTKLSAYNDTTSSWIESTSTYGTYGNVTATTDGNGNTTSITYGSIGGYSNLYPTQVVQASGTLVARTMQTGYDFYTGLVTSTTDYDNSITNTAAYDIKLRPTLVKNAYGSALENWIQTDYHDYYRYVVSKADLVSAGDAKKVATQFFDQMGRVRLSKTLENAATQSATNETEGLKVETKYAYASGYAYQLTSNPFRADYSYNAGSEETMGWNRTKQWATGRESQVETFSGASLPSPWGSSTSTTGVVDTALVAEATTVTDQTSKVRRSITDSLGRLGRVDEPTTSGLGTVSSPNQYTSYTYDVLNNLTGVSQGSQSRSFTYNSLGRLTSAVNPESGTTSYGYDSNGNLTSKYDARTITTSYGYDALNRVTQRSYNDSVTLPVNFYYDSQTLPSGAPSYTHGTTRGRLIAVTYGSGSSNGTYRAYDLLGHVTQQFQRTDGVNYQVDASYNLAGLMTGETYPGNGSTRRSVSFSMDAAGRLASLTSSSVTYGSATFPAASVSSILYAAQGAMSSQTLGNGLAHTINYNSRLQPTNIQLGSSGSVMSLSYTYGTSSANNGNLSQIAYSGGGTSFTQTFTYDELNRLATSQENSGSSWSQTNGYDRYGNRTVTAGSGVALTFNTSTNRITNSGFSYDNDGNVTADNSHTYTFDAENKVLKLDGTTGYAYDGEGRRVRKYIVENTRFVYGITGDLLAEYDGSSGAILKEYMYGANSLLATIDSANGTQYMTSDHLGSPRLATNSSGTVTNRRDFMPFGEEITTGAGRSSGSGWGTTNSTRQKFTGYELDTESGLDFAQARYHSNALGRFLTPDNFVNDTHVADPKSWNLYVYVRNNPLSLTDPNGEEIYVSITDQKDRDEFLKRANYTYGCGSCVTIDKNGYLRVDTNGLSKDIIKATQYLTDAINSKKDLLSVTVTNNNKDVAFGDSQAGTGKIPGVNSSVVGIRLDFADDKWVSGDSKSKDAFLNLVFAHEVAHFEPDYLLDPVNDRGKTGPVVDKVNEIQNALGLPLRAEYSASKTGGGDVWVEISFGKARTDKAGQILRNNGAIQVERQNKVARWVKNAVGGKGIN